MAPGDTLVECLVQPRVSAGDEVIAVVGVDPQRMVVAVLFRPGPKEVERRAAVTGNV